MKPTRIGGRTLRKAFLADPTRRALAHPTPSPKRCLVETEDGRIFFDANADPAPAKDVPAEAHRRFRDDLRVTREQNLKTRAEQLAQHEEKKKFAADWIAAHGTPDQQVRQAAGVLSIEEAIDAMTDYAFGPLADRPRYVPDGVSRIQEALKGRIAGRQRNDGFCGRRGSLEHQRGNDDGSAVGSHH